MESAILLKLKYNHQHYTGSNYMPYCIKCSTSSSHLIWTKTIWRSNSIPILQMRKVRLRQEKQISQRHIRWKLKIMSFWFWKLYSFWFWKLNWHSSTFPYYPVITIQSMDHWPPVSQLPKNILDMKILKISWIRIHT